MLFMIREIQSAYGPKLKNVERGYILYNLRIIANTLESRRSQMLEDKTPSSLFNWIYEFVCLQPLCI